MQKKKKSHDEQNIKILNKERIWPCICTTLPHSPHPNPNPIPTSWSPDSSRVMNKASWSPDSNRVMNKASWSPDSNRVMDKASWSPDSSRVMDREWSLHMLRYSWQIRKAPGSSWVLEGWKRSSRNKDREVWFRQQVPRPWGRIKHHWPKDRKGDRCLSLGQAPWSEFKKLARVPQ